LVPQNNATGDRIRETISSAGQKDRQRFGFIRLVLVWLSLRSRLQELEQRGALMASIKEIESIKHKNEQLQKKQ
jgi:hypothetical protein